MSRSLPELCFTVLIRFCLFEIPLGIYSRLNFSLFQREIIRREAGKIKRERVLDFYQINNCIEHCLKDIL